jgi:thiol-disulfide isomerase/thioredoxin
MKRALALTLLLLFPLSAIAAAAAADDDRAVCAVCGPREGAGFEPVRATATYRGTQYAFCSLQCKVDFLKNPAEFLAPPPQTLAPAFSLARLSGSGQVSLSDFSGKVVLLDFWATYCAPCVAALPRLQALHTGNSPKGFAVVGLIVDEKPEMALRLLEKAGATYPQLEATAETWNAYRINALPSLVLVGRDGKVKRRFGGEADAAIMEAEIAKALAEPAPAAR